MNNKIVAIVGMCGSGKSEVANIFIKNGYERIYFGGVTMKELEKRHLEVNEENEKKVRESLRKEYGIGAFAHLLLPEIEEKAKDRNVVLDGLYSWQEYLIIKERFKDEFLTLAVITPKQIRYNRLKNRPIRPLSYIDAQKRDYAEIENIEKGGPIAMADIYLVNDKDFDNLVEETQKVIDNLKIGS